MGMSLRTQTQGLQAQQELLRSKRVKGCSEITQYLHTHANCKGEGSESLPELQAVVPCRWLDKLGEPSCILAPVKFAAVDDNPTNGGTMSSNPFSCTMDDNIGAVFEGTAEISTSSKCIVNLNDQY